LARSLDGERKNSVTMAAMPRVAEYTKKGARIEKATTSPPTRGPAIPPKRKPLW
jgi:hypothetical protein